RIEKNRVFRKGDVHPGLLEFAKALDRALKFALERSSIVHVFGKVRDAEIGFVEQFKTNAPGFWQALARQLKTHLIYLGRGHENRGAVIPDTIFGSALLYFLNDGRGVLSGH